ncbi:hypothetical protein N7449_009399 [Penicillium cf. viridicatum]|uniref:Uncharacterized protein n=1 Tax=Penicillium cf. viridicatum TaxID=2972119 RepID=A0A9W9JBX8_9EURO|nr:hypothetical protein N7449_009399 [Penicillium cf. viridicatum]
MDSKLPPRSTRAQRNGEEWWANIDIPKTEEEWEDAASIPFEKPLPRNNSTKGNTGKGKEPATATNKRQEPLDRRIGKSVMDLHVREMNRCVSASKINVLEYLTRRILWHRANTSDLTIDEDQSQTLTDVQKGLAFENEARQFAYPQDDMLFLDLKIHQFLSLSPTLLATCSTPYPSFQSEVSTTCLHVRFSRRETM